VLAALCVASAKAAVVVQAPTVPAQLAPDNKLPEIQHYKAPGLGYKANSPLFSKERATAHLPKAGPVFGSAATTALVSPVSTSIRCIVNLVTQFFVLRTALYIVTTVNFFKLCDWSTEQKCLKTVVDTDAITKPSSVFFIPMLCVLFLAARMRAVQLTQGRTMKHELPQWWVKSSMSVCSWSVLILSILVLVGAFLYGDTWEQAAKSRNFSKAGRALVACRSVIVLTIYAGFTLVCIGTLVMPAPDEIWGPDGGPPTSIAAACTVLLSAVYFSVYLALEVARVVNEAGLLGPPQRFHPAQELMKTAAMTVAFAPMLCALFIATRLRATQLGYEHGDPPSWVQAAACFCTGSICLQTLLAVVGAKMGVQDVIVQEGGHTDLIKEHGSDYDLPPIAQAIETVRLVAMFCLYTAAATIVVGMYSMSPAVPVVYSGSVPPTLSCLIILTTLYFASYLLLWVVLTVQRRRGPAPSASFDHLQVARTFLELEVKDVISVCPMVCVLFLATFMRALQVTGGKGAPPSWCQNVECLITLCIVLLVPSRIDMLRPGASKEMTNACIKVQQLLWGILFVCIAAVVVSLFTMGP
jgi:hypothetical protein